MNENIKRLSDVYTTLCNIEVKGESNIQYMYGCMSVIKDIISNLYDSEQTEK